jgi:ferritin-like metal-binding protein YciE
VTRLEQVFEALGAPAKTKKCPAIDGLIQEAAEMIAEEGTPEVIDAGLIASAQRVEHYEMAAYGNLKAFAVALGHDEVVSLLESTLHEEHGANKLLSKISTDIVVPGALAAAEEPTDGSSQDEGETGGPARASTPARAARTRKLPTSGRAL